MPTVAELDILIDATDRATDDLTRIGALVDSMGDREFDIVIKALIDDALGDLAKVDGVAEALDGKNVEIEVNADTVKAEKAVIGFIEHMKKLGSHSVVASRNVRGIVLTAAALAPALAPIGIVGVGGLAAFAAAGASAGAGLGLFAAVATSAYSEVNDAITQIKQGEQQLKEAMTDPAKAAAILKIQTAYNALTPAQTAAVKAQIEFGKVWDNFVARYEPAIFQMIAAGFDGIALALPKLTPMLDGVTSALWRLEQRALTALASPFWQTFFDYLGRTAGPMVEGFGLTLGNLAKAFAGLMIAFEPLTIMFINGMVKMSEKFAEWATTLQTNKGFQEFVDYVVANTPVVLDIVGQLWKLFVNLVEALMPIGERALPVIRDFLDMINRFADAHPHIMTTVVGFIGLVAIVMALSGPVAAVWAALKLLAAPLAWLAMTGLPSLVGAFGGVVLAAGGVGAAILTILFPLAALGLGIAGAIIHFDTFVDDLRMVIGGLGDVLHAVDGFANELSQKVRTAFGMQDQTLHTAGKNWMQRFGEGGREGTPQATLPFENLPNNLMPSFSQLSTQGNTAGTDIMSQFGFGAAANVPMATAPFATLQPQIDALIATLPPSMQAEAAASMAAFGAGGVAGVPVGAAPFGQLPPEVLAMVGDTSNLLNPQGNQAATSFGNGFSIAMLGVVASVAAGMTGINKIVVAEMATMKTNMDAGFAGMGAGAGTSMAGISASVSGGMTGVRSAVVSGMAGTAAAFSSGWSSATMATNAGMTNIAATVAGRMTAVRAAVVSGMAGVAAGMSSGWASATMATNAGMANIVATVAAGMNRMAILGLQGGLRFAAGISSAMGAAYNAGTNLANAAVNAVQNIGARMYTAGSSGGSALARGLNSQVGAVRAASNNLARAAARPMPGSPAAEGPLSGQGYALYRGQRFGEDLARGIRDRVAAVTASANQIAGAMALSDARTSAATYGASRGVARTSGAQGLHGTSGGGTAFTFNINNPIAEATSVTTNKALQRVATLRLA